MNYHNELKKIVEARYPNERVTIVDFDQSEFKCYLRYIVESGMHIAEMRKGQRLVHFYKVEGSKLN